MTRAVAVSPHLDDAAFSAGATLVLLADAGFDVVVVTAFTATVPAPSGFALACQLDKGVPADADYMALRRAEDRGAVAALGARAVHLPLPEAPHRGYDSAAALFGAVRVGDDVAVRLAGALREHVDAADVVLAPRGVGAHVDHRAVVAALRLLGVGAAHWTDQPYALRAGVVAPADAEAVAVAPVLERKLEACAAYVTQVGFHFGGAEAMRGALGSVATEDFTGARVALPAGTSPR